MNKILVSLGILVLIGGGCAAGAPETEQTKEDDHSDVMEIIKGGADQEESEEGSEDEVSMGQVAPSGNTETQTITTDSGMEVTFETETQEPTEEVEETEETEVVDVVLGGGADVEVSMESGNFFFSPSTITAAPGESVEIMFAKNSGFHTFVIDEISLKHSIKEGAKLKFTAPSKAGSYAFYCDIGSHRAFGMEGTLIVK